MPRAIAIDKDSPFFGEHCALCKNTFAPGEEIIVCAECGTRHHTFCWQEVGNHCTAYGCNGHGEVIRPNRHRYASARPDPAAQAAATAAAVASATPLDPPQAETRPVSADHAARHHAARHNADSDANVFNQRNSKQSFPAIQQQNVRRGTCVGHKAA